MRRSLIQVDGCIYDAEFYPNSHGYQSLDSVGREAFVNHLHIAGPNRDREANELIEAWRASMASQWPDLSFRIYRHEIDEELIVRFHVIREDIFNWYDGHEGLMIVQSQKS